MQWLRLGRLIQVHQGPQCHVHPQDRLVLHPMHAAGLGLPPHLPGHMHTDNGSDLVQYTLYQSHAIPCVWVNTMEAYTLQQ